MTSAFTYVNRLDHSLPSVARTVTAQGSAIRVGSGHTVRAFLDVTAASGTSPSMTLTLETSHDGSTGWLSAGSFAAKTGIATERKSFSGLNEFVRWSWVISGTTPSFTFSCNGKLIGA